jgi:non-specific serine/threonine protein kinase/serine/threonine-protein kinase
MFEIHDAIRDLPGSTSARRLLVTRALEYLDSLNEQSKGDVSLQKELAAAYERVGDVLGYPYAANLGDKEGALQSYRKALAIRESLATISRDDVTLNRDLVGTYFRIAHILESNGNFSGALAEIGKAQEIAERLARGSNDPVLVDTFAGAYYFTASLQIQTGDLAGAQTNYQRSASIRDASLQANPGNLSLRTHLAADFGGLAKCLELSHDLPRATEIQSKAVAILEEVAKSNPQNTTFSEYLAEGINRLATYRKEQGDASAALEIYRKARRIFGDLLAADAKNSLAKSNVGFSNNGIAASLLALGQPAEAGKIFQESIDTFEAMSARTISNRYPRSGLAEAYSGLGAAHLAVAAAKNLSLSQKRKHLVQARSACQKSLALRDDKEKRGELENAERTSRSGVVECVGQSEKQLIALDAGRSVD